MLKKRKSKAYLILSSCHLGMSDDILDIFSSVAKYYKAKTIHLGPTATEKEYKRYQRLKIMTEKAEEKYNYDLTESQEERLDEKISVFGSEQAFLATEEKSRIKMLLEYFGKVTVITNDSLTVDMNQKAKGLSIVDGGIPISKYLFLSPIPPTSMRATRTPISSISTAYLKERGKSWIVAHPVPAVEPMAQPGLNQASNYFTVGSLQHQVAPNKTNEQYQYAHMPAAVLVLIDKDTDEFHARHLDIDYLKGKFENKSKPAVLDDGLVFLEGGKVINVKSSDKATISTDDHAPHQHPGVVGSFRYLNMLHKPATLINGGDTGDFESINRHAKGSPGETEGLRLINDLRAVRRLLDAQANVTSIKKKILLDSNHHEWLSNLVMENPCLIGMLDWKTLSDEMFPDWDIIIRSGGDNEVFYFGDYAIRHGDKDGGPKKAEGVWWKYLCGHFHRYQRYRRGIMIGCGCKLGPKYIGNQVNAWQNMIASLTKYNNVAAVAAKVVLHDKIKEVSRFAYRNEIYEVPHYHVK